MNIKQLFLTLTITCLALNISYAQKAKLDRANKHYENLAYSDASEIYLDLANSGYTSKELLERLGNCYYFNANYIEAANWYHSLLTKENDATKIEPIYYLRYAQSLKATDQDALAAETFNKYIQHADKANVTDAASYLNLVDETEKYRMQTVNINSNNNDYGGFVSNNKFYFTSSKSKGVGAVKTSDWDGNPYLNLYEASIDEDGVLHHTKAVTGDINSSFHESSAIVTKDGNTMYFTRSNSLSESKKADGKIIHSKIYRAHLIDGKWDDIEDLSINSNNYSTAHPALNSEENKLYFSSDMPGTIGQSDLFVASINENGNLGEPQNLGAQINTIGRESFPFITTSNELYFSSDGHFGLGGYDVFFVKINDTSFSNLVNVGKPINSAYDDFAFTINDNEKGYISSNRPNGLGKDDIYAFEQLVPVCNKTIEGTAFDYDTGELITGAKISLYDADGKIIAETTTANETAEYTFTIDNCADSFKLVGSKEGYKDAIKEFTTTSLETQKDLSFSYEKIHLFLDPIDIVKVEDKYMLNIKSIYFELNRANINEDAAYQLSNVVNLMRKYPDIIVEFGSHTDSRASDQYNMKLSMRRAESTKNWIIERGVDPSRISGKGYGETQLVNHCSNGVKCSEDKHQLNRRSEFVILNPEALQNEVQQRRDSNSNFVYQYYTVVKQDTLYSIAKKHNITVERLKELNGLNNNTIKVGQKLKVK